MTARISFTLLLLAGCTGTIADGTMATLDPDAPPDPVVDETRGDAFVLSKTQPRLLSFEVRLQRVAAVVGVDADDPMFDEVRRNRIALGDYDHASNVLPDGTWTSARIALWTRLMMPVCESDAMRSRYTMLPDELDAMLSTAYGRDPSPTEIDDIAAILHDTALDTEQTYRTVCLAVLGSAELMFQ